MVQSIMEIYGAIEVTLYKEDVSEMLLGNCAEDECRRRTQLRATIQQLRAFYGLFGRGDGIFFGEVQDAVLR